MFLLPNLVTVNSPNDPQVAVKFCNDDESLSICLNRSVSYQTVTSYNLWPHTKHQTQISAQAGKHFQTKTRAFPEICFIGFRHTNKNIVWWKPSTDVIRARMKIKARWNEKKQHIHSAQQFGNDQITKNKNKLMNDNIYKEFIKLCNYVFIKYLWTYNYDI